MSAPLLSIRADATAAAGAGHVMRCLAVAAAWRAAGGRAELLGTIEQPFALQRARELAVEVRGAAAGAGDVLLVDVYDAGERRRLAGARYEVRVLVDDIPGTACVGYDAIWNPNAYAEAANYAGFAGEVLAGADCVPLRDGLPPWDAAATGGAVSLGGGRDARLTPLVQALPRLTATPTGWSTVEPAPPGWRRANPADPWRDLCRARWVLIAAGSMLWEASAVGIPVMVLATADNHRLAADYARRHGAPVLDLSSAGGGDALPAERWVQEASGAARPLPRLQSGAAQVARRLRALHSRRAYQARPAHGGDARS